MDAPAKKKVRKKWTIEETKMLVDGCNKVIVVFSSSFWHAVTLLTDTSKP
jgi:hypothetical protein